MQRRFQHLSLIVVAAFTVSTVGLPIVTYYCSMQGTVRMASNCCVCAHNAVPHGAAIAAPLCVQKTAIGMPIAAKFVARDGHAAPSMFTALWHSPVAATEHHGADRPTVPVVGTPPPLLLSSLLRI